MEFNQPWYYPLRPTKEPSTQSKIRSSSHKHFGYIEPTRRYLRSLRPFR
ncbi:BgTH12-01220 [Blumeria graminis f. sp. triticale]|uniref:BgTH12-01220 n=1 Tax=Blumeria graminis f. sp. triticale TaxID=1689686 RepID=A0A9W4GIA1_BLUGR|nr:BgTH12-01220 [Blumeria graminis f. sp. triticale]